MSDSYIRFGKEEDQEALLAGLYPSADEEDRERAVAALRNLAQAAAQPDAFPSAEDLTELVTAALRLGMAREEGDSLTLPDILEPLSDRLNENSQAVMIEVRAELAAFRYAVALWDDLCSGLRQLHCAPPAVREAAEAFLDSLDVLSRSLALVGRWRTRKDHPWLSDLQKGLKEAREDAIRRIEGSQARERLWPLCDKAGELRLGDLLPSLTTLLSRWARLPAGDPAPESEPVPDQIQDPEQALVRAGKAVYSFEQILREDSVSPEERPEWTDSLVREIMRLAEKGLLGQVDMEAARKALEEAPARWAKTHQEALRRNGLKMPVFLVQSDQGLWTAPEVLRITPEEARQALAQLPGADRTALTAGSEGPSVPAMRQQRESSLLALPDDLPVEGFALASRELHLAGVKLLLFGDDRGLWCAVWGEQGKASARCHGLGEEIYGSQVQIPLIQVGGGAGSRQALGFRPGPLRKLIRTHKNIDRAYSRQAYVITVGESLLRNFLGWNLGGECTERLNRAAWEAGVRTYAELRSCLLETAEGLPPWLGEIQTAEGIRQKTGASNLGELVASWSKLTPPDLGAEIDTLMSLPPEKIGPVDGDLFVLIPTDTATSLLCALLIGRWLHGRFPYSDLRIHPCEALKQREQFRRPDGRFERRHDPSQDVSGLYRMLDALMKELLMKDAADPMLLISGGVKWTTLLMLQISMARHLACVYKFEPNEQEVKPVVFRWDEWAMQLLASRSSAPEAERTALPAGPPSVQPVAPAGHGEPEAERPCPVINVGIGLFRRYCRDKGLNPNATQAEADQLVRWALGTDQDKRWRLCAELTEFEAWKRATHTEASNAVVALIQTASETGRVCGEAIETLLRDQGAEVLRRPEWEILDLTHATGISEKEQVLQINQQILEPFQRCLDDLAGVHLQPDVLTMAGQALTSALMQFSAMSREIRVFLALEAEAGALPALWPFPAVPWEPDAPIPIRDAESAWD